MTTVKRLGSQLSAAILMVLIMATAALASYSWSNLRGCPGSPPNPREGASAQATSCRLSRGFPVRREQQHP